MPRFHPDNVNEPATVIEHPILTAVGPYAFFTGSWRKEAEVELSNLLEALAIEYGGEGYRNHDRGPRER